jgi:predicted outer membrane repeat protein
MNHLRFDDVTRRLSGLASRRNLLNGFVATALGLGAGRLPALTVARKKKRKKKKTRKATCGKAGSKPVKGKCCAGLVLVDRGCQRCDVCQSGCQFSAIQAAIDTAKSGDTIIICPGTYREKLTIARDVRLVSAGDTIVMGSGDGSVVRMTSSFVTLEHLRITGGLSADYGGGIVNDGGTLKLIGCTVSGNTASFGGGIFNFGTLELIGCAISENAASAGGGIYINLDGTLTVDAASRITGNTASNTGGGIFTDGTVTLASSAIVSGNTPDNCVGTVANCND